MDRPVIVGLYPRFLWFFVKFFQNLASAGVSGVLFYFIIHLNNAGFTTPWMFYLLEGAALATIVSNLIGSVISCISGPNPVFNTIFSAIVLIAWGVGTGLFINAYKDSMMRQCTVKYWGDDTGVLICNLYRVVFICALVASVLTIAALIMDALAWKKYRRARHGYVAPSMMARGAGNTSYMPVHGPSLHPAHGSHKPVPYSPNMPYDPEGAYQGHGYGR